jgi:hypothetical protein
LIKQGFFEVSRGSSRKKRHFDASYCRAAGQNGTHGKAADEPQMIIDFEGDFLTPKYTTGIESE